MLIAELRTIQNDDDRLATRTRVLLEATSADQGTRSGLTVHDVSTTGLLIASRSVLPSGSLIAVDLLGVGVKEARIIWTGGKHQGAEFLHPLSPLALRAVCRQSKVVWPTFVVNPLASHRRNLSAPAYRVEGAGDAGPAEASGLASGLKIQIAGLLSICLWALIVSAAWPLIA